MTRYYDPVTGRFISPDNAAYLDPETIQGLNLYAYCNNNPVMGVDPTGTFLISTVVAVGFWIGLIVGAVAGATAGGIIAHNVAKENGAKDGELIAWTLLGIFGGCIIGGVVGAAVGSAVGYGVGLLWGTAPVAGSNGAIALWSGGKAAADLAASTGANLVSNTFAGKTLTFVSRFIPKAFSNFLWGHLSAEFVAGAASATIFLAESGVAENSTFFTYEIWVLLQMGIERVINFVG